MVFLSLYAVIVVLFFFWSHAFRHMEFIRDMKSESIALYSFFLAVYIMTADKVIDNKGLGTKLRFLIFLLFILNVVVSKIFSAVYEMNAQVMFFTITASLPYLVYGFHLSRKFIRWSTNATRQEIKWMEESFINRLYYIVIFAAAAVLGYFTHIMTM